MTISKATSQILDQLIQVINQLSTDDYVKPLAIYNGSTIGKHFRHIHDFYSCLVKGSKAGCVDFCQRERNSILENNPQSITESFETIKKAIFDLEPSVIIDVYGDFEYENGVRPITKSSIGREMLYAYDHAVHHLAIVKLGIRAEFPNIEIDNNIGIAASTLRHQLTHN